MASQANKESDTRPTDVSALHGDILESIFSRVPLVHLVPASQVSLTWHRSLHSKSLSIKPWLIIHHPRHTSHALAYDPRSHVWLRIKPDRVSISPSPNPITKSVLRASNSTFLYAISSLEFSFSSDPLHLTWTRVGPTKLSRVDPVVAKVGSFVVVAGGGYDFEDDPMAVEIYDLTTRSWSPDRCESMPSMLKSSASSLWLSVSADDGRLLVTEKSSGATFVFDTISKSWTGPFAVYTDPRVYFCVTGFVGGGRLILIGLLGDCENCEGVRVWEIDSEMLVVKRVVVDMPEEMVMRLKGESFELNSVSAVMNGDWIYLQGNGAVVTCEFDGDGGSGTVRWGCVVNEAIVGNMVLCCSDVGMAELKEAMVVKKCEFTIE